MASPPPTDDERGAFYPVFKRRELAARWRYATTLPHIDALGHVHQWSVDVRRPQGDLNGYIFEVVSDIFCVGDE